MSMLGDAARVAIRNMTIILAAAAGMAVSSGDALGQCQPMTAGTNVDVSRQAGNDAEGAIAVDPTNTQRLFVFSNADTGMIGATSNNGGASWTRRTMATGSDGLAASCCDPSLAWDTFGNLFCCYINASVNAVIVGLSTNGGNSFTQIGSFSGGVDQPTITAGANSVWVCYNLSGSMVARGASVSGLGVVGAFSGVLTVPSATGSFGDIAIGPSGQVMLVYQNPSSGQGPATIFCNTDADGLGAGAFGARVTITSTNVGGFDFIPAQNNRSIDAEAGLAWDRSGGVHNGRVYLVYTDETPDESNNTDIYVKFSDNNGTSWSASVKANDDATTRSQFLPRIAIDQTTGVIALSWMDARNSASNNTAELWGTISTDFGATFKPNVKISSGISNANTAGSGIDFGDYLGLCMHGGAFYPVWADNSGTVSGYVGSPAFDQVMAKVTVALPPNTPTSPQATPSTVCLGQATTLSASVGVGETVDWFTGSCGGTAVPGGPTPNVTPAATTTYFARARNTTSGCVSASCASVTVTVATPPGAPTSQIAAPPVICLGQQAMLQAAVNSGETVDWFTNSCGGTPVPGGAIPNVSPTVTTTYYARARNLTTGCVSATCATVVLKIGDHSGDFDGGGVGLSDVPIFLSIVLSPGTPQDCIADMNADGLVDGRDIQLFTDALTP